MRGKPAGPFFPPNQAGSFLWAAVFFHIVRMGLRALAKFCVLCCAFAGISTAGNHRHEGFSLTVGLGTGMLLPGSVHYDDYGVDRKVKIDGGLALDTDVKIGFALRENLVLSVDNVVGISQNFFPFTETSGLASEERDYHIGFGLTYYPPHSFMPSGAFATGIVGMGLARNSVITFLGQEGRLVSDLGPVFSLKAGVEPGIFRRVGFGIWGGFRRLMASPRSSRYSDFEPMWKILLGWSLILD